MATARIAPLRRLGAVVLVAWLGGCASTPMPDLERLYAMQAGNPDQPPVVLIHGALGSRLAERESGREIWPGSVRNILFSDYETLRLEIDPATLEPVAPQLTPSGVFEGAVGVDYYGRILETLERAGGYEPAVPGTPARHGEKRYYVFIYDWRQDNVHTVRELDAFLAAIREDYGNPQLKVDIIAHSMGGMITRYFVRYGTADELTDNEFEVTQAGAGHVRRVVLLGTPSLGSIGALRTLIRGYQVGFGTIPPEIVATFPSTYQVLPHAIAEWFVDIGGQPLSRDQFSAEEFWRRFRYSVFNDEVRERIRRTFDDTASADAYIALLERYFGKHIERARRFSWSLTVPVPDPTVRYIVFGSDCYPTPARAVLEEVDGRTELRLGPREILHPANGIDYERLMLEPGDGTVTKASLLARQSSDPTIARHKYSFFPIDYPIFLCEKHTGLTGNIDFRNNLLHALLSVDR